MHVGYGLQLRQAPRGSAVCLSDVLQRLSAKDLCRLRTVCRSCRFITSDQVFIRAHVDSHKETLFVAKFQDDNRHVYVVDLSGNVVKRIASADGALPEQEFFLSVLIFPVGFV
jgi:hypothetical protein